MEDRVAALAEIGWDVLHRIVRELLARKPGGHLLEGELEALDLRLRLALTGPEAHPQAFSENLVSALDRLLDDAVQQAAAFRPGHAFCHRCAGAGCEHSVPPSCRHVFVGYAPTGTPRWEDFAQVCLDMRQPEVDRLYEDPPAFLTIVQDAAALQGGLLDAFQASTYELLGQLTAGFFRVRAREEEGRGVLALTFQVAASRGEGGGLRLGLNLLGRTATGEDLGTLWDRHHELPWRRAVRWAQAALRSIVPPRQSPGADRLAGAQGERLRRRVAGILNGLARRLERDQRARFRRTLHAEERHESGERPTRKAVEDARASRPAAFLVDERTGAVVVLGERGRTHFFTREGRLVSSARYSRDAIERKRKLGLWREATEPEVADLRARLGGA
jgi:hypothetical protein